MEIIKKIKNRSAVTGVIGLGYVGLPLAAEAARNGFLTYGFDVNGERVEALKKGQVFINYLDQEQIAGLVNDKKLIPTTDFSALVECDVIVICVPTPLTPTREPDLSYVKAASRKVKDHMREGQLVVLTSTTYPGTTNEVMVPILEESGLKAGEDFFVAFSPEREDPGNEKYTTARIPKVVGGYTKESGEAAQEFFSSVFDRIVPVSTTEAAEFTKLLENIYRSVNIAMINELKMLSYRMEIDIWEVIEAASTKPFGFQPFYPGPGLGGHCIPIDPFYLSWKSKEFDFPARFIELSGEINTRMPYYVVDRIVEALNREGKALRDSRILLLGVAYKKDVGDVRESPALKIISLLRQQGASVTYNDPFVEVIKAEGGIEETMTSVSLDEKRLSDADVVVITTNHSSYDYAWIVRNASLVVDCRNATRDLREGREKIFPA